MKQISKEENRPRRLKILVQKPAVERGGGRRSNAWSPLGTILLPSGSVDISYKDDVAVNLFLSDSFMVLSTGWTENDTIQLSSVVQFLWV